MKKTNFLITALLILVIAVGSAIAEKNFEFRVLAAKGKAEIKKNNTGNWVAVTAGIKFFSGDQIKLAQDSYIGMVHNSGKTLELKSAGTFAVSDLSKQVVSQKSKISKRFANYVMDEIGESEDLLASGDYHNNMSTTGSVERSINNDSGMPSSCDIRLKLMSPKKIKFMNPNISFSWSFVPGIEKYEFHLSDRFDRPEFSKTVNDTCLSLNAQELDLERGVFYFWKVTVPDKAEYFSDEACFLVFTDKEAEAVNDTLNMLKEEIGDEENSPAQLILAAFYEDNSMINEALAAYNKAVKLSPDVAEYQYMYMKFLKRNNLAIK